MWFLLLPYSIPFLCLRCCLRLCATNCDRSTLTGTGVGSSSLSTDRKSIFEAEATVRANVFEALDVIRRDTLKVTFNDILCTDNIAEASFFGFGKIFHASGRLNISRFQNISCNLRSYTIDISKGNMHLLVVWNDNAGDSC